MRTGPSGRLQADRQPIVNLTIVRGLSNDTLF